jgi:hypothetical protein
MAAENDVLHFQVHNSVLDYGKDAVVTWSNDVGDVAVYEDVAGLKTEKGSFGDSGVRAADPNWDLVSSYFSIISCLYRGEGWESIGKGSLGTVRIEGDCPAASFGKKEGFWCCLYPAQAALELNA